MVLCPTTPTRNRDRRERMDAFNKRREDGTALTRGLENGTAFSTGRAFESPTRCRSWLWARQHRYRAATAGSGWTRLTNSATTYRLLQHCVERALAVAFQIKRHVVKAKWLENRCEFAGHFDCHCPLQFIRGDLDAHDFAVKAYPELAKPEPSNRVLAAIDGFHILNRHRCSVGNP